MVAALTLELFNSLYWDEKLPIRAVAKKLDMDQATLRYRVKKIGGVLRSRGDAISLAIELGRRDISGENNPNYRHGKQVDSGVGQRWAMYGITREDFELMKFNQNNCCAICRKSFEKTPSIDHCHETGKVRGLLCYSCNIGIGNLNDSVEVLESAIIYLKKGAVVI